VEGGNGEERGGSGRSVGHHSGPAAAHARGVRPAEQGRGGGADWWAMAIVPGGGTG
jgi:hypothetical protein